MSSVLLCIQPQSLQPPKGVIEATEAAVPLEKHKTLVWMGKRVEVQHESPFQLLHKDFFFFSRQDNKHFKGAIQNNNNKVKPVSTSPFLVLQSLP